MVRMKRPFSPLISSDGPLEMSASEFKARCLAVMQAVHDGHAPDVVVTKHGKPLVTISRARPPEQHDDFFGSWRGRVEIVGDVVGPFDEQWGEA